MKGQSAVQGDVFDADLSPVVGREQAGRRPVLVISVDAIGTGPSGLAVVVPFTRTDRGRQLHVRVDPPDGGLKAVSFALPEQVRSISRERLGRRRGTVSESTLRDVLARVSLIIRTPG